MCEETKSPAAGPTEFEKQLESYREKLEIGANDNQREFDKAVIALSGGALGISIGLLKDVFGRATVSATGFLLAAWVFWAISLAATLYSFYFSAKAYREELKRLDDHITYLPKRNSWTILTAFLNAASGILFILGIISIIVFLKFNPLPLPAAASSNSAIPPQQVATPKTP